jgi:hypothetical protein
MKNYLFTPHDNTGDRTIQAADLDDAIRQSGGDGEVRPVQDCGCVHPFAGKTMAFHRECVTIAED